MAGRILFLPKIGYHFVPQGSRLVQREDAVEYFDQPNPFSLQKTDHPASLSQRRALLPKPVPGDPPIIFLAADVPDLSHVLGVEYETLEPFLDALRRSDHSTFPPVLRVHIKSGVPETLVNLVQQVEKLVVPVTFILSFGGEDAADRSHEETQKSHER